MPLRPTVEISFPKEIATPGEPFVVVVNLHVTRACDCNDIVVRVGGSERRFHRTRSQNERHTRQYHRRVVLEEERTLPGRHLEPGAHTFEAELDLPADLPPSYASDWSDIEYVASVEVDVVGWLNARGERPFRVGPTALDPSERQALRCATAEQVDGTALYLEASLPQRDFRYADTIRGDLAIWNGAHHAIKVIELGVATVETPLVDSVVGAAVTNSSVTQAIDPPGDGLTVPFAVPLHRDLGLAFQTPFIEVSHVLFVRAVLSLASDVELRLPIRLMRPSAEIVPAARAGYVGLERARYAWKKARSTLEEQAGVTIEEWSAIDRRASFTLDGTRVTLRFEDGRGGGRTSVTVDYPDLGLGLRLSERRWTHFGRGLDLPLHDDRFFVTARDPGQARAFLTPLVLEALGVADEAALDDEAAVISLRASMRTRASVDAVIAAALQLARCALAAYAVLPAPSGHGPALAAYRSFAAAYGARLRAGDLSLSGLTLRGLACALRQRFDGAAIAATSLHVMLPQGLEPTSDQLSQLGVTLGQRITRSGRELAIERPPVDDPAQELPLWESLAQEIVGWARGALGPYRG